jgi:predicted transcriptional regulator YheO
MHPAMANNYSTALPGIAMSLAMLCSFILHQLAAAAGSLTPCLGNVFAGRHQSPGQAQEAARTISSSSSNR